VAEAKKAIEYKVLRGIGLADRTVREGIITSKDITKAQATKLIKCGAIVQI